MVIENVKLREYTHIKIAGAKGYFIDTINPGGDNLYTADQIYI